MKIVSRVEDIQLLRPSWERLLNHPGADIDWFLSEIQQVPKIIKPYIIQVLLKDHREAILIGRVEERKIPIRISRSTVAKPLGRVFIAPFGGLLGCQSPYISKILLSHLLDYLKNGKVDMIQINGVDPASSFYKLSRSLPKLFCRSFRPFSREYYRVSLPDNIQEFLGREKPKHRRELLRYIRVLEREFEGNVEYRIFRKEREIHRLCEDTEHIAKTTLSRAISEGFVHNRETEQKLSLWARKGWLRGYILYVNQEPISFWIGALVKDTFHLDSAGFRREYRKWNPGTVLLLKMVEDICNINVKGIEYSFGNFAWKKRFSDEKYEMTSVVVYAASLRGMKLKFLKEGTALISYVSKKVLDKANLMPRVRKFQLSRRGYRSDICMSTSGEVTKSA